MQQDMLIICLHGFGENKDIYANFIRRCEDVYDCRCVALDLPGHGAMVNNNEHMNGMRCKDMRFEHAPMYVCRKIEELLLANPVKKIVLVGTSYGGIVSYLIAEMRQKGMILQDVELNLVINDVPLNLPYRFKRALCKELIEMTKTTFTRDSLDTRCEMNGFKIDRMPRADDTWDAFLSGLIDNDGRVKYSRDFFEYILANPIEFLGPCKDHLYGYNIDDISRDHYDNWYLRFNPSDTHTLLLIGENSKFFEQVDKVDLVKGKLKQYVVKNGGHFIDLAEMHVFDYIKRYINAVV